MNQKIVRVTVKYVKKARMWCKSAWFSDGKQKQEWFETKPELPSGS